MRRLWLVFSQTVTVAVAVLFVLLTFKPQWLPGTASAVGGVPLPLPTLAQAPAAAPAASGAAVSSGFALAARRAAPAVVSVVATRSVANPHADDPRFRFFFGERGSSPQQGMGSAVIVAPEGYLLTNHHVVEGASDIEVRLNDGRSARARVVGSDAETDIAVLKIDLPDLPAVTLGDVRALQVGDAVLAIGNPFNVGQTVTAGIVSALDRTSASQSQFQNFIQTDAAINPGNSGGALVDAAGHLVGINTAIFSRSGGNLGIGFAVPVDTARDVMQALIRGGVVRRGWIGVEPRELNAELAESLQLKVKTGVLITGVLQDGPAAKGGVRPGDVVLQVGERKVEALADLFGSVAALEPGSRAALTVLRDGQTLKLSVQVGERPRRAAPQ
jgi:serine protease DegQ